MSHIKRFLESTQNHSRLSVEEIEDYFLEFIQSGDIHYYHSGIPIGANYVSVFFTLDRKFNIISDSESMTRLTQILTFVAKTCKRWELDWEFRMIASGSKPGGGGPHQSQLEIRQPVPQIVIDQFPITNNSDIQIDYNGHQYKFNKHLKQDEQLNFYMVVVPSTCQGGSGQHGKWLKSDWEYFSQNEDQIISQVQKEFSKLIPCEYLNKNEYDRDTRYGTYRLMKYQFKLSV